MALLQRVSAPGLSANQPVPTNSLARNYWAMQGPVAKLGLCELLGDESGRKGPSAHKQADQKNMKALSMGRIGSRRHSDMQHDTPKRKRIKQVPQWKA
jgi:hypothetical protein